MRLGRFLQLLFWLVIAYQPSSAQTGSICVGPVPLNSVDESFGVHSGPFRFEIQIDTLTRVKVLPDKSITISNLAIAGNHMVRIFRDGKRVESFKFSFSQYRNVDLYLWFKPGYSTWSLWDDKPGGFDKHSK